MKNHVPEVAPTVPHGIERVLAALGGTLLDWRRLTTHKDDYYLYIVLVQRPDRAAANPSVSPAFATWLYNSSTGDFHYGHYFDAPFDGNTAHNLAIEDFRGRK